LILILCRKTAWPEDEAKKLARSAVTQAETKAMPTSISFGKWTSRRTWSRHSVRITLDGDEGAKAKAEEAAEDFFQKEVEAAVSNRFLHEEDVAKLKASPGVFKPAFLGPLIIRILRGPRGA
jgi:hypothetical protein